MLICFPKKQCQCLAHCWDLFRFAKATVFAAQVLQLGLDLDPGPGGSIGLENMLQLWPEILVISTKKTTFITCIIPLK